ncbi:hypothetical protein BGX20_006006, partial [Mortierella sp. AD010]
MRGNTRSDIKRMLDKAAKDPTKFSDTFDIRHVLRQTVVSQAPLNESTRRRANPGLERLYSALNGILPTTMKCPFKAKANGKEHLDLIVTDSQENWAAYELKVNAITQAQFNLHLDQAKRYQNHFKMPIYLVNFHLEGHKFPDELKGAPRQ